MTQFRDNTTAHRFELDHPNGPSFARYSERDGVRIILHVETPASARGHGYAAALMDAVVEEARQRQLKLTPLCSYAVAYFRRHADRGDVLA